MEDSLEEGMATHSSILGRTVPGTEEPGRLLSTVSQSAGHNWSDWARNGMANKENNQYREKDAKIAKKMFSKDIQPHKLKGK